MEHKVNNDTWGKLFKKNSDNRQINPKLTDNKSWICEIKLTTITDTDYNYNKISLIFQNW